MKRSTINRIIREGEAFFRSFHQALPPFAHLDPETFRARRSELSQVIDRRLGWDVTDYGKGDFDTRGLFLFTMRNGEARRLKAGSGMVYAEKLMISRQDQISPMHRHVIKTEDIINRGGATLALEFFESDDAGELSREAPVVVWSDGVRRDLKGGDILRLAPGESVTLEPGNWHAFWGEGGDVLIGEVSTVNDDLTDNVFAEPLGRFAEIEEDEAPYRLLVSDYDRFLA